MDSAREMSSAVVVQLIRRLFLMYDLKSFVDGHASFACKVRALSARVISFGLKNSLFARTVVKKQCVVFDTSLFVFFTSK